MRSDFCIQSFLNGKIALPCRVVDGFAGFALHFKEIDPCIELTIVYISISVHHNPEIISVIIQSVRQIIEVGAVLYLVFRFGYGFCCCRSTGSWWSFR